MEHLTQLIESIQSGNAIGIEKAFRWSIGSKLAARLAEAKDDLVASLYSEDSGSCPPGSPDCKASSLATKITKKLRKVAQPDIQSAPKVKTAKVLESTERLNEGRSRAFIAAKATLKSLGVHIHPTGEGDEVRVVHHTERKNPDKGYFTDDLDDAVGTGRAIAKEYNQRNYADTKGRVANRTA